MVLRMNELVSESFGRSRYVSHRSELNNWREGKELFVYIPKDLTISVVGRMPRNLRGMFFVGLYRVIASFTVSLINSYYFCLLTEIRHYRKWEETILRAN